jgi:ATP-dependent DNA helicase RecG
LKERGMGQLAGTRQSGGIHLRFTDLSVDGDLVSAARIPALEIIEKDPDMVSRENTSLRRRLERRYERGMELFRIG